MRMASIIIADENEGRRNLLANTFEREGYDVTRLSTLAQTEATAGAVAPDVLLLEVTGLKGMRWMFVSPCRAWLVSAPQPGPCFFRGPLHRIFCPLLPWQGLQRSSASPLT